MIVPQSQTLMVHLADHLQTQKHVIIEQWLKEVEQDETIRSASNLTHLQIVDHLPEMFNEICRILREQPDHYRLRDARTHGHFRWQEGYQLDEVLHELGLFRIALLEHTMTFVRQRPDYTIDTEIEIRRCIHKYLTDASIASAEQYAEENRQVAERYQDQLKQSNRQLCDTVEQLQESEQRFRAIFEQAAVGIAQVGLDGRWLRVNEKLCQIVGYTRDELMALSFQDITFPGDIDADLHFARQMLAGEIETYSMEKQYLHKHGSIIWVNLTVSLVRSDVGTPRYFIAVLEDISDKKRAQETLRQSEAFLRRILESSPNCIKVLDLSGEILYMNPCGQRIMEIDDSTPAYNNWLDFWQGDDQSRALKAIEEARDGEVTSFQGFCPTMKGSPKWWDVILSPITDENNRIIQLLSIARDITARVAAEKELLRKNEQLESLNNSRMLFMRTIAHEIGNLLNAMVNSGALLRMNIDESQREKMFNIWQRNSKDMRTLLDQLLDYSAILAGQEQVKIDQIALQPFIRDIVELFQPIFEAKGLQFHYQIDNSLNDIFSDELKLKRIINNLLSNAVKYTSQGAVELTVQTLDQDRFRIVVADSGEGISSENMVRLFEEFQRFYSTREAVSGAGLGLAITRRLVNLLGGEINVTSKVGMGSQFEIILQKIFKNCSHRDHIDHREIQKI